MDSEAPLPVAAGATLPTALESPVIAPQTEEPHSNNSTPRKHIDSKPIPTDSLITIPLSDADRTRPSTLSGDGADSEYRGSTTSQSEQMDSWRSSGNGSEGSDDKRRSRRSESMSLAKEMRVDSELMSSGSTSPTDRSRSGSTSSTASIGFDWEQLDRTEAREDADADSDEVCSHAHYACSLC
jgi:hypothetical protein